MAERIGAAPGHNKQTPRRRCAWCHKPFRGQRYGPYCSTAHRIAHAKARVA